MVKGKKYTPKTHKPSLKTVYKTLNRKEPFTPKEKKEFSVKERNLIRGLQLRDKQDKKQAIESFKEYKSKSKKGVKSIASSIRKYLKTKYPKQGGIPHEVTEFEKPKSKTKIRQENKKQVLKYTANKQNKYQNEKRYTRVKNASLKYPNAGMFELEHGVNSKASQEWRIRHGLDRNYK